MALALSVGLLAYLLGGRSPSACSRCYPLLAPRRAFPCLGSLATPINFWLLVPGCGAPPAEDVALCRECCESHRNGDSAAVKQAIASLSAKSAAVELDSGDRTFQLPGAKLVRVHEISFGEGGLGHSVWDAGIALSIWLSQHSKIVFGKRVLELGSGVGLAGLSAGIQGASSVTLSDVAEESSGLRRGARVRLLENLSENVLLNGLKKTAHTINLNWETCLNHDFSASQIGLEPYPVVIGSDLVYYENTAPALAATVLKMTAPGGTACLMNVKNRRGSERFLDELSSANEGQVDVREMSLVNNFGRADLMLITFRRKG